MHEESFARKLVHITRKSTQYNTCLKGSLCKSIECYTYKIDLPDPSGEGSTHSMSCTFIHKLSQQAVHPFTVLLTGPLPY